MQIFYCDVFEFPFSGPLQNVPQSIIKPLTRVVNWIAFESSASLTRVLLYFLFLWAGKEHV